MECFKCKKGIEEQYNVCCNCFDKEINELKDKLHRRNMQIKDLKKKNKKTSIIINCDTCRKCGENICGNDTKNFKCWEGF